jgi:hypothetical protein
MNGMRDKRRRTNVRSLQNRPREKAIQCITFTAKCGGLFEFRGTVIKAAQATRPIEREFETSIAHSKGEIAPSSEEPRIRITKGLLFLLGFACRFSNLIFEWIRLLRKEH